MEELIPGADPEQVAPAGQPFVLARPGTPVARIAADLKEMPLDEARRAYIVVETGAGAYAVVGAWELNDALAAAGPADWGRPLQEVVPHPHPARALNVEAMDSHQARTLAQARQPVLLLRQGRPWRLLPGALRPVVHRGGGGDLFTVSREVLDPYLAPPQASLEALLPKGPREPREAAQESYTTVWGEPRPRVVNFWFATPEGQALAQQRPLELGRRYLLQVNLGRRRAESLTAAGSPAIREPAPETAEGTPLHVCLFSDDFDIPQPTHALMLPPEVKGFAPDLAKRLVAIAGALRSIAQLKLPVRVVGLVCAAENMPGPDAIKPGDVVKAMNGKSVEYMSTDAEGRMVLADGLCYSARYQPAAVIDCATLTGSIVMALSSDMSGVFANDDPLFTRIQKAADAAGEPVWRMPIWKPYRERINSDVADMKGSTGTRYAGAITAALFLQEFVPENTPWAHMDIAGTAWQEDHKPYQPRGASANPMRTLVELARAWAK